MRAILALVVATMCCCGGRSTPVGGDGDGDADADGPAVDADEEIPDGAPFCECPTDGSLPDRPTFMYHRCVPPLLFGCEAQPCTPGGDDCPDDMRCDEWGAAACCFCAAVVPACVPAGPIMGPLPEYLALNPVYGPAGVEQDLEVTGFPFYVGALFYLGRVGDSDDLFEAGGETCSVRFRAPAQPAGTVPVRVSQYGGEEPWVLAGFFTYGAEAASCQQPGYPCGEGVSASCCETPEVPMSCQAGRCLREE